MFIISFSNTLLRLTRYYIFQLIILLPFQTIMFLLYRQLYQIHALNSLWGLVLVLGGGYFPLSPLLSPTGYLALCAGILALLSFALYRLLLGWGVRKWESL